MIDVITKTKLDIATPIVNDMCRLTCILTLSMVSAKTRSRAAYPISIEDYPIKIDNIEIEML